MTGSHSGQTERQKRLQILVRKNYGKKILPDLIDKITTRTSIPRDSIDIRPLEESDAIREPYEHMWGELRKVEGRIWVLSWHEARPAKVAFSKILLKSPKKTVMVYLTHFTDAGALRLSEQHFLRNAAELLEIDGDDVWAVCDDCSNGVLFDKFEERGQWVYELRVWGDDWRSVFEN